VFCGWGLGRERRVGVSGGGFGRRRWLEALWARHSLDNMLGISILGLCRLGVAADALAWFGGIWQDSAWFGKRWQGFSWGLLPVLDSPIPLGKVGWQTAGLLWFRLVMVSPRLLSFRVPTVPRTPGLAWAHLTDLSLVGHFAGAVTILVCGFSLGYGPFVGCEGRAVDRVFGARLRAPPCQGGGQAGAPVATLAGL
jgi:hypothetical protein